MQISKKSIKKEFNKLSRKAKWLFFTTPIEIVLGAAVMTSGVGYVAYNQLAPQAGQIPLAYSQIDQNTEVLPLSRFYAVNNDAGMIIFESNNAAYAAGNSDADFAKALSKNIMEARDKHLSLSAYAEQMPGYTQEALGSAEKAVEATQEVPPIESAFSNSWSSSHVDYYRTEYYQEEVCDSENHCHSETKSRQVYDHTQHSYTYYPQQGELASRLLNEFIRNHPDMTITEALQLAQQTSEENKAVIKASRHDEKPLTDDEYLALTNTWAAGSNLLAYAPKMTAGFNNLGGLAPQWENATRTAHSESYITYSHFDSGPREFQIAGDGENTARNFISDAHHIVDGMMFSGKKVPELNAKVNQYIDVVLNHQKGDAHKLRDQIMDMAADLYQANETNGFDVHPFKWLDVILLALLGMAAGAALGEGANYILDKKKDDWFDPNEPLPPDNDPLPKDDNKNPSNDNDTTTQPPKKEDKPVIFNEAPSRKIKVKFKR
jgi:hypothetical protein